MHVFVKRLYFQFLLWCKIKIAERGRKTSEIVAPKYQPIANFFESRKQEPISAESFVLSILLETVYTAFELTSKKHDGKSVTEQTFQKSLVRNCRHFFKFISWTVSRIKDITKHKFIKIYDDSLQFYWINTSVQRQQK